MKIKKIQGIIDFVYADPTNENIPMEIYLGVKNKKCPYRNSIYWDDINGDANFSFCQVISTFEDSCYICPNLHSIKTKNNRLAIIYCNIKDVKKEEDKERAK